MTPPVCSEAPFLHADLLAGRAVSVAGVPIVVRAEGTARAEAVGQVLRCLPLHPGAARVEISFGSRPPPLPERPAHARYGGVELWRDGETLLLRHAEGVAASVTRSGARLGGAGGQLIRAFRQLFPFMAAHLLGFHGCFVLHGGAVRRGRRAILVLGGSGAGKSTLILAATGSGWSALADDLVAVRASPAGLEVAGIAKPLAVPREAAWDEGFSPIAHDARKRWTAPIAWDRGWHKIATTVVSAHSGGGTELRRLGTDVLLEWLVFSFLSTEPTLVRPYLAVAAALTAASGWELRRGRDPASWNTGTMRALDRLERTHAPAFPLWLDLSSRSSSAAPPRAGV